MDNMGNTDRIELENAAERDALTGLYGRASAERAIDAALAADAGPWALMVIDIDDLSGINDSLGHLFGDDILRQAARGLRELLTGGGRGGVAGRIGGDEFVVLAPARVAMDRADDVLRLFGRIYAGEGGRPVSGSVGIARSPRDGATYAQLFARADIALYDAKRRGKNRVEWYDRMMDAAGIVVPEEVTRPDPAAPLLAGRRYEDNLLNFALDILTDTKDPGSAIILLLGRAARLIGLERAAVYARDEAGFSVAAAWREEGVPPAGTLTPEELQTCFAGAWETGLSVFSDAASLPQPLRGLLGKLGTRAAVQCRVSERGQPSGILCYDICSGPRAWSDAEVDTLFSLTKVIAIHLINAHEREAVLRLRREVEQVLATDRVTGLMTFDRFCFAADEIIRGGESVSLVCCDFDKFGYVNELAGFEGGDRVLASFADLCRTMLREGELLCRYASDRFLMLLRGNAEDALRVRLEALRGAVAAWSGERFPDLPIRVVAGAYPASPGESGAGPMIDRARIACKAARAAHGGTWLLYDDAMHRHVTREREMELCMTSALGGGEFAVYLQPTVEAATGRPVGAEALVRWAHEGQLTAPGQFIPLFQKNGFIRQLDWHMIDRALALLEADFAAGRPVLPLSVNLSRAHLRDERFVPRLLELCGLHRIAPELLELELMENCFADDPARVVRFVDALRAAGFSVAIDDFGAGYSALGLLRRLGADRVKLDRSFLEGGSPSQRGWTVLCTVVRLARDLGMEVVAEGVETKEQEALVRKAGCTHAQGYLYSPPMPAAGFAAWAALHSGTALS